MRVQVGTMPSAVTVPLAAVQHGPDGLFAYTVKPDNTVAQTSLQVGYQDQDTVVVTKGLTGGETAVLTGQSRLAPGVRVAATDAAKAPPPPPPSTGASSG
jgi:multidrug efflux system membrane fusion protein